MVEKEVMIQCALCHKDVCIAVGLLCTNVVNVYGISTSVCELLHVSYMYIDHC